MHFFSLAGNSGGLVQSGCCRCAHGELRTISFGRSLGLSATHRRAGSVVGESSTSTAGHRGTVADHPVDIVDEWSAETRDSDDALDVIEQEWDDLHGRCAAATPFQSSPWVRSWWAAYGSPGQLRLVLVRRNGQLVAGAALTATKHRLGTVLTPVGAGLSDFEDVLVDDRFAVDATRWLVRALLADTGWHRLRIDESRPGGAARRLYDSWPGPRWQGPGSICLELTAAPLEQTLAALPRDTAKSFRRQLRKIDAAGLRLTEVPAAEAAEAVRDLLRLHRRQWEGRPGVNPEHLSTRFEQHLATAAEGLVRAGQAVVLQYRQQDLLVASELFFVSPTMVGAYLFGFDPVLREQISVIVMLDSQGVSLADRLGRPTLSLLRGEEPYKLRWRPRSVPNGRLVLGRPRSLAGAVEPHYLRARAAAVALAARGFPRAGPCLHRAVDGRLRLRSRLRLRAAHHDSDAGD